MLFRCNFYSFNTNTLKNTGFLVDYPTNDDWLKGNLYIEEKMSSYAVNIKTEHLVCPNKKCNLMNYKDDDHLRSSYVKANAFWIDEILEK